MHTKQPKSQYACHGGDWKHDGRTSAVDNVSCVQFEGLLDFCHFSSFRSCSDLKYMFMGVCVVGYVVCARVVSKVELEATSTRRYRYDMNAWLGLAGCGRCDWLVWVVHFVPYELHFCRFRGNILEELYVGN